MPSQPFSQPIRILVVEDHDMVAEAMCMAFARTADLKVVGRSSSKAAAVADAAAHRPDVVLLDRRLTDGDGIDAITDLRRAAPDARVLVLAGEATASVAVRVADAGGSGLISKNDNLTDLEDAVRRVFQGDVAYSKGLLGEVLDRLAGRPPAGRGNRLTPREHETLALLGEGLRPVEISRRLGVALNTARNHIQQVLHKLGAATQLEAVVTARREGLIP